MSYHDPAKTVSQIDNEKSEIPLETRKSTSNAGKYLVDLSFLAGRSALEFDFSLVLDLEDAGGLVGGSGRLPASFSSLEVGVRDIFLLGWKINRNS